jgi:hypothetical protein
MTSDAFFDELATKPKQKLFDVIFIDGLHTYEQTFKDIINALHHLNPNGVIVLHDINPENENMALPAASRDQAMQAVGQSGGWCGDSWKAVHHIIEINHSLNQLDVFTLNCDYGLGIIFPKQNFNKISWQNIAPDKKFENLPYAVLEQNRVSVIGLVEPDFINRYLNNKQKKPK